MLIQTLVVYKTMSKCIN